MKTCPIEKPFVSPFTVAIIGCGNVGSATAHAILMDGSATDLILMDRNLAEAEGLILDFEHSMSFFDPTRLKAVDKASQVKKADLIIITAGARQKDGDTRRDLIGRNREILQELIPALVKASPKAIFLIVSNPVDVLTYEAWKISGLPKSRVFGTGTLLDSARLQFHIAERLCISPKSVDAFVLGEHGDSSFPVWSTANISGMPLLKMPGFTQKMANEAYEDTRQAAYRIINDRGYTCYSIATVILQVMLGILHNSRVVWPLSTVLEGEYGHSGMAISVPCVLDSQGISQILEIPLNSQERKNLKKSVEILKKLL